MRLRTIPSATPLPHNRIKLAWGDGSESVVDLGPVLAKGDVFTFLHDPAAFNAVAVGPRGRTLVWRDPEGRRDRFLRRCSLALGPPGRGRRGLTCRALAPKKRVSDTLFHLASE
jgi:hypothetical protein